MTIESSDDAAEMDQFREAIAQYNNVITSDTGTTVEYICGEGDPPFIKYRLTIESISTHSPAEFEDLKSAAATSSSSDDDDDS